jgi:hypothetical protein
VRREEEERRGGEKRWREEERRGEKRRGEKREDMVSREGVEGWDRRREERRGETMRGVKRWWDSCWRATKAIEESQTKRRLLVASPDLIPTQRCHY